MAVCSFLSIPDLDGVLRTLEKHHFGSDKWDDLGLKLGLYYTTLSKIKAKCSRDPKECLTAMLEAWLKKADDVQKKGGPTWISLVQALKDMSENSVAEQIEKDFSNPVPPFTSSSRKSKVEQPQQKYDRPVTKAKQNALLSADSPYALSSQHTPLKIFEAKHVLRDDSMSCLQKINFLNHYKKKFTLESALSIGDIKPDYLYGTKNPQLLLKLMLQKIMMSNYKFRKVFLYELASNDDEDEDEDDIIATKEEYQIAIHPMDALIALLLCADDFLRQDLYSKLVSCQVAVPLLLPDPVTKTLVFPLWAMRSIVKYWKCRRGDKIESFEDRVINCRSQLVSFIRFSQPRNFSKSKLLNNVVVSDTKHKCFMDYESKGSSVDRRLVDGLVEVCWYFPSGEENEFNDVVTFANLRGNASNHRQQLDFLIAHSDMAFVFLEEKDIRSERECLQMFASSKSNGKVTFVADSWSGNSKQQMKELVPHCRAFASLAQKEFAKVVDFIGSKIRARLSGEHHQLRFFELSSSSQMLKSYCIKVDEDTEASKRGKCLATGIMKNVKDISVAEVKKRVVPLQGPELWQTWATLNKKQNRMKLDETEFQGIEKFFSEKREQKENVRRKQQICVQNLHVVMTEFMQIIFEESKESRDYFIQWLKFLMDDHSRAVLPHMQKECQRIREELRINKTKAAQDKLKKFLQEKSEVLIQASFGIEHLFRELGQIYESTIGSRSTNIMKLPTIAAQLLISGMPLEIVDGDAAHIPLVWITAVFNELTKLLYNPRIFVISVLGIQSTGKSTLLNTLFGVRFAVSAGRCTRGAYCQLLKLDPELSRKAKCDYMLIIDTEGLRAPELDIQDSHTHDNELSTLVIGLASVTIINIFGEVPADIKDILQTTVHAFIRMKEVELNPSCLFVRHHVADVTAGKTNEGKEKFLSELDKMTVLAAKGEHRESQYHRFNDVISYNNKDDIYNFPSLWEGNPPMAPVDPAYSEASFQLKSRFINFCKSPSHISTLKEFTRRVSMLWEAVLTENFVFSFKNTLEVEAYNTLDTEFGKWSWRLQNVFLQWQNTTRNLLKSCQTNELDIVKQDQIRMIHNKLDSEYDEVANLICLFFEDPNSSLASLMTKWRAEYEQRVKNIHDDYKRKAQVFCTQLVQNRHASTEVEHIKNSHREIFKAHVKALVSTKNITKESKVSDAELDAMFDVEWKKWMRKILEAHPSPQKIPIDHHISNLVRKFRQYEKDIIKKMRARPLEKRGKPLKLILDSEKHIDPMHSWFQQAAHAAKHFFTGGKPDISNLIKIAEAETLHFISLVTSYLNQPNISFEESHVHRFLSILFKAIDKFDETNDTFKFTNEYRVDLALEVCGFALHLFTAIQEDQIKNHPSAYMESMRNTFRTTFKALCTQTEIEKIAATCLTNFVVQQLHSSLQDKLALALVDDLKSNNVIFTSKRTLKGNILLKLLDKQSFDLYKVYLTDISQSYLYWIAEYIEDHCKQYSGDKQVITKLAEDELNKLIKVIIAAANRATSCTGVKQWLTSFQSDLSGELPLNIKELHDMVEMEDDSDLKFFTEQFLKGLEEQQKQYLSRNPEVFSMSKSTVKPAEIIRDQIAGCCQQCPFCKEQCEGRLNHEEDHFCTLHRPDCLGGYHWTSTKKMSLDICTSVVGPQSIIKFNNKSTENKAVYYRDYRTIYPNWSIPNEMNMAAPYWKWFVVAYQGKIVEFFEYEAVPLDEDWKCVTVDDARSDVKKRYQL